MRAKMLLLALVFTPFAFKAPQAAPLKLDTDRDETIDLAEMEAAAAAAFDRLDKDTDTTLSYDEAKKRMTKNAFRGADPDEDQTLTKEEYVHMAEKLFKAADINNDGTLDARELQSRAGQALERLLK